MRIYAKQCDKTGTKARQAPFSTLRVDGDALRREYSLGVGRQDVRCGATRKRADPQRRGTYSPVGLDGILLCEADSGSRRDREGNTSEGADRRS